MIEHGIHTSTADYWVHFFPLEKAVHWYRVEHMLDYIRLNKPKPMQGKSKDGTVTGEGYLIPRTVYFVRYDSVPDDIIDAYDWTRMTDRECGFFGEHVVSVLAELSIVKVPIFRLVSLRSRTDQLQSKDFKGQFFGDLTFESKTERPRVETIDNKRLRNLFVQTKEGGHRVHLQTVDGQVSERITDAPGFSGEEAA